MAKRKVTIAEFALNDLPDAIDRQDVFLQRLSALTRHVVGSGSAVEDDVASAIVRSVCEFFDWHGRALPLEATVQATELIGLLFRIKRMGQVGELAGPLLGLFDRLGKAANVQTGLIDRLYDQIFMMVWKTIDDFHATTELLRDRLVAPYAEYLDRVLPPPARRGQGRPGLHMAYVVPQLNVTGSFSIGRVFHSLYVGHEQLASRDVRVFVYCHYAADPVTLRQMAQFSHITIRRFDEIVENEQLVQAVRRQAEVDRLDVVISEGYLSRSLHLLQSRLAPVQIYMPMSFLPLRTSGVDHILAVENVAHDAGVLGVSAEQLVTMPFPMDRQFLAPRRDRELIAAARAGLPAATVVFVTLTRMEKISPRFAVTVIRILGECQDAIFVVAGPNDRSRVESLFAQSAVASRVVVLATVDPHVYGALADVFLDTFGFCQGVSALEAQAKGVPVVHLRCAGLASMADSQRDSALVFDDEDGYIEAAVRLAQNPAERHEYGRRAKGIIDKLTQLDQHAQVIEKTCRRLLDQANARV